MMENISNNKIQDLTYHEMLAINGGWGGGGSLGYAYIAAAHEMGDFCRGVFDGLSSMWK